MDKVRNKLFFAAAVVIVLNLTSCGKYEDGPNFSLRTKKSRLTGKWKVEEMDGDKLGSELQISMEFEKNGDFSFTYKYNYYGYSYSDTYDGEWDWEDGKEKLQIEIDGDKTEWEIKRLTNSEFWFEDEDNIEYKCEKD